MKRKKIIFVISFIVLSGFFFGLSAPAAKAATVAELQAQIQQLMTQIVALQQQLSQLRPKPIDWCHTFNANLGVGNRGPEVTALQTALQKEGLYQRTISGNFDEYTASIVVAFQEKYVSEILTPWRLVRGTGYVGPSTRAKLNKLYGCRLTCQTFWWHDNNHQYCQQKQFCDAHMYPGLSTFQTKEECEVNLKKPSITSIAVISPNGGEKWAMGETYNIKWRSEGLETVTVNLYDSSANHSYGLVSNIPASQGNYNWTIPGTIPESSTYKIQVSGSYKALAFDQSDNYFSIVSSTPTCTDSDGGKDYYTKGKATGAYVGSSNPNGWIFGEDSNKASVRYDSTLNYSIYYDHCFDSATSKQLNEAYCTSDGKLGAFGYQCPYGCKDGACIRAVSPYITSIYPTSGRANDTITIYGKNLFGTKPSGIIVEFLENGVVRGTISSPITESSDGSYLKFLLSGTFVGMQGTGTYQVRVLNDYGKSNTVNFTIVEKSITVISPNGGERLVRGNVCAVRWESKGVNLVRIYVFNSNIIGSGSTNYIVPNNQAIPASQGYYNWTIGEVGLPAGVDEGAVYKIRIDDVDSNLFDSSDNYFSIVSSGLGLKNIENQLASLTEAVSSLIEQVRILMGR